MTSTKAATGRKTREGFGRVRKLPSGRHQAAYLGPDGRLHKGTATFDGLLEARGWLTDERRMIDAGTWTPPESRNAVRRLETFQPYADAWLADRTLKPRTRSLYRGLLDSHILPEVGDLPLRSITPAVVRSWYAEMGTAHPTRRAHAYGLLRTILGSAMADGELAANPCHIRGAGSSKRVHKIRPASLDELRRLTEALPERYRVMVLMAAWCGLRWGELTELRRGDVQGNKLRIRRAVVVVSGETIVDTPKSDAGIRDVTIPPHLLPALTDHLAAWSQWGPDGLVFPAAQTGRQISHGGFWKLWQEAREAAGRPDLRFHDLRHTGAVLAAQTGATLAELMNRLGHSTPAAAMRYQHAAEDRDAEIARKLSLLAQ